MDRTVEKIKSLRSIAPDADFASISRSVILSSSRTSIKAKRSFIYEFGVSLSVMATAVMIAVMLGNIRTPDTALTVSNLNTVENEAVSVNNDIDIALREVSSFDQSAKKTAMALTEAAGNNPAHLNESVLTTEIENLDLQTMPANNVDDLLNQAIF